jgi:hypothetical protein
MIVGPGLSAQYSARAARTVVSGAGRGEIVLGLQMSRDRQGRRVAPQRAECVVIDHEGEPLLAVQPGHPAIRAAQLGRLVRLELAPIGEVGASLSGRLTPADIGRALAEAGPWEARILRAYLREGSCLLQVRVDAVTVGPLAGQRPVGLDDYALADPDVIQAHGPRIIDHLNHAHPGPLRESAAVALNLSPDALIAARIARVDADGLDLWAVDASGAQLTRMPFTTAVTGIDDLVDALRGVLVRSHPAPNRSGRATR